MQASDLHRCLSADELARAGRYYSRKDRDRFVAARGLLRVLLGQYLGQEPRALKFRYGAHGKPELAQAQGQGPLRFNLAHSHGLTLVALTLGREVGVDVEYIRVEPVQAGVAEQFFSSREAARLRQLPPSDQALAFFRCWTRKEAYLKAIGLGLSRPLDQCEVSMAPDEPAALISTHWDHHAAGWSLRELDVGPGLVATVAAPGRDWQVCLRQLMPDVTVTG